MAGAACKVLANNGVRALTVSLERILTEAELNGGLIEDGERRKLIQAMADIDAVIMHGGTVEMSLVDIMRRLEEIGVLSPDVWSVYASGVGQEAGKARLED